MAPIRLGIIGLSSSAVTSWASGAHLPYLLSPRGLAKYKIVALCNSSVESAKSAIKTVSKYLILRKVVLRSGEMPRAAVLRKSSSKGEHSHIVGILI